MKSLKSLKPSLSGLVLFTALTASLSVTVFALNYNYQEKAQDNEDYTISSIADLVAKNLEDQQRSGNKTITRDAHAKHHGCLQANFSVQKNIPAELKVGVFADAKTYPTWLRFSNGSGKSQDDHEGDARGLAIKLMNVKGEKILPPYAETQDFLLINNKVFFIENLADYLEFFNVLQRDGNPLKFFTPGLNPIHWHIKEALIARQITSNKMTNPLRSSYFSTTPYLLGQHVIKYGVKPCQEYSGDNQVRPDSLESNENNESPNFLRENMATTLNQSNVCLDFMVQVGKNTETQPLENPMIEWKESEAPFVKVAQILIAKQEFASDKQMKFCENLSFTPWHSLPEHRPLGATNRARKVIYQTVSTKRHQKNGVDEMEPTPASLN